MSDQSNPHNRTRTTRSRRARCPCQAAIAPSIHERTSSSASSASSSSSSSSSPIRRCFAYLEEEEEAAEVEAMAAAASAIRSSGEAEAAGGEGGVARKPPVLLLLLVRSVAWWGRKEGKREKWRRCGVPNADAASSTDATRPRTGWCWSSSSPMVLTRTPAHRGPAAPRRKPSCDQRTVYDTSDSVHAGPGLLGLMFSMRNKFI